MASSIVTSVAQKLGGLLVDEAKYLYKVSDQIESLQTELEWMACYLEDADNMEHQDKIVSKWVSEMRDIAYDAEDVIEKYLHEVTLHRRDGIFDTIKWFSCCVCDVLALHSVGTTIDVLKARILDLIPRMQMYGIKVRRVGGSRYNMNVREQRQSYSFTKEAPIGLDEQMEVVVGQLLENTNANVIGIVGMGGLGKTTLAQKVFSNIAIKEHFQNKCVWIYLSKEFDKRNVFEEILMGLSANEDPEMRKKVREFGDEELHIKICEMLKEERCLVVVDDIWYTHSWDRLMPTFGSIKGSNSKILITTRNQSLVKHADDVGYSHRSNILSEENSWKLLKKKAFSGGEENDVVASDVRPKLEELGRKMVKRCNGLPLAIIALGGILHARKTVEEWEIVQKNISSYLMCGTTGENANNGLSQVLDLSYCDLPFYLKPCFLYLGIFTEDYEIQSQRLYHLWEAEGFVSTTNQGVEIEGVLLDEIAESYLNQLVQRSMVEVYKRWPNGSIRSCRVHDIMRDMCLQKCKNVNFLSILGHGGSNGTRSSLGNTTLRRCSVYLEVGSCIPSPQREKAANIRSLLMFPVGRSYESFEHLPQVRVLDMQGVKIRKVPREITNWIHMRYLSLRKTYIEEVPRCIFHLVYLETLDLRSGWYDVKVHHDFRKLERLRHLYLPPHMKLATRRKAKFSTNQLSQMETFKYFDWEFVRTEDLAQMVKLRIFTLTVSSSKFLSYESLKPLLELPVISEGHLINRFKWISLDAKIINEKPATMSIMGNSIQRLKVVGRFEEEGCAKIFYRSLKMVELVSCEIGENYVEELGKLPCLESLWLTDKAIKGSKMSFSEKSFLKLIELTMTHLRDLEEWEVGDGALPNLRTLNFCRCRNLRKLPRCLPTTVKVTCEFPCIPGIENYDTCKFYDGNPIHRWAVEEEGQS